MAGISRVLALVLGIALLSAELRNPMHCAERPRLYGIKNIAVSVRADPDGDLDRQKLRTEVESKLRKAGIRVDSNSRSHLNIVIGLSAIRSDQGVGMGFAYSVHLGLTQQVYLAHNPNRMTEAVTWQTMALGIASDRELGSRCERVIGREMDEFVSVYLDGE